MSASTLEILWQSYEARLIQLAYKLDLDLPDTLQAAYARLCEVYSVACADPSIKNVKAYCWRVVQCSVYQLGRTKAKNERETATDPCELDLMPLETRYDDLYGAISTLPESLQGVISLRFRGGYTQTEVAAKLGVALCTAQRWEQEALKLLRAAMG